MPRKRPELPTDTRPDAVAVERAIRETSKEGVEAFRPFVNPPVARFSEFPYDLLARYINNKVEFTVEKLWMGTIVELETPWKVKKLT